MITSFSVCMDSNSADLWRISPEMDSLKTKCSKRRRFSDEVICNLQAQEDLSDQYSGFINILKTSRNRSIQVIIESDEYSEISSCQENKNLLPNHDKRYIIKELNKDISSKILEYCNFDKLSRNQLNIINQNIPELIFLEIITIINNGLTIINNNFKNVKEIIPQLSDYVLNLNNLKNIFKNIYDNMSRNRRNLEFFYMDSITPEEMSFGDYEKIQSIRYTKMNFNNEDNEKLIRIISVLNSIKMMKLKNK